MTILKNLSVFCVNEERDRASTKTCPKCMVWKNRRYIVAILAFFGFFNAYALRSILSVAIVAMTENKSVILDNNTVIFAPEFAWDSKTRGYILSSFFYGYVTSPLVAGWLSAKLGGKYFFGGGVLVQALLSLLTPWSAATSVYLLVVVQALSGVAQGVIHPSINAILAKWAPLLERSRFATMALVGCYVGILTAFSVGAILAKRFGWSSSFYFFGVVALVWSMVWWLVVAESPEDDPRISEEELEYIRKSLGNVAAERKIHVPWKDILKSAPVWALTVGNFAEGWGFFTLLTELPAYIKDTFSYDLDKAGFVSALPYVAESVMIYSGGVLSDWLLKTNTFSVTQVRKIVICTSLAGVGIFTVACVLVPTMIGKITCLMVAAGLSAASYGGFSANFLDIAPQYASAITGFGYTISFGAGIVVPVMTGYIVTTSKPEEWQIVFGISSGMAVFGSVVYGIWASGEVQPWAVERENDDGQEG